MAHTFTEAFEIIEKAAGLDFDLAVGYAKQHSYPSTDPAEEAAWCGFDLRALVKMAEQIEATTGGVSHDLAEEALGAALVKLLETRRDVFSYAPNKMLGLLRTYAVNLAKNLRKEKAERRTASLNVPVNPHSRDQSEEMFGWAVPAIAYTRMGVDEEARFTPPPKPGDGWERLQAIGAVQRFRDDTGRAPRVAEMTRANGLPDPHAIERIGFENLNDLLLEAGVPIENPNPVRKKWDPLPSAEACYRFRRREGFWPNGEDAGRLPPGELPSRRAMDRFFGGVTALKVQLGCEAILGRSIDGSAPVSVRFVEPEPQREAVAA